jgi:chromosome segregation ATPase
MFDVVDQFADELAIIRALGLISAIADPQNAKVRMAQLATATAEYVAQREAAQEAIDNAEPARAAAEQASAELDKRTTDFQTWTNSQEARFRKREADVRNLEELLANRSAELSAAEANLAKRAQAHDDAVADLKQRLAS